MRFNVKGIQITPDKFYQHDYIFLSIEFLKLILFLG